MKEYRIKIWGWTYGWDDLRFNSRPDPLPPFPDGLIYPNGDEGYWIEVYR